MEKIAIERKAWIHAPRQQVWRSITEPEQLEQWYAPGCPWEIIPALQAGATVKFYNSDTDIQLARIEVVEPLQELTLRWQIEGADSSMSLVNSFRLEEVKGGTHVTATQTGYELLPEEVRQQLLEQDEAAYMSIVENLKTYLERKNS